MQSALALAALLLLAPLVSAQAGFAPAVDLRLSERAVRVDAGGEAALEGIVRNAGSLAGTVQVSVDDLGGWRATLDPANPVRLEAGESATIRMRLTAPGAGDGATSRIVTARAQITDDTGRVATSEARLEAVRVDPPPTPPTPWYQTPAVLAGLAVVALAAFLGWMAFAARKRRAARIAHAAFLARETGIVIAAASGPVPFGRQREQVCRVRVTNATDRPRVAVVGIAEASAGWRATTSLPRVPLSPGETLALSVVVAPPDDAPAGARARIIVYAKPEEARELDERIAIDLEAPDVRIPPPVTTTR